MTNTKIPGELTVSVQDDMFVCTDGAGCFTRPATNDEKLLWAEIVRLRTEHEADLDRMERAAQAIEQYQTWHAGGRANIESQGDVLRICDGEHEKFAPCQFVEYRRVSGDSRLADEPVGNLPTGTATSNVVIHEQPRDPPLKSSAVLDHRFLPDGMDPGICQKCGSTRTSHRDQQ